MIRKSKPLKKAIIFGASRQILGGWCLGVACICGYVHVYIYINTYIYRTYIPYVYTYVYAYVYIYIYIFMYLYLFICIQIFPKCKLADSLKSTVRQFRGLQAAREAAEAALGSACALLWSIVDLGVAAQVQWNLVSPWRPCCHGIAGPDFKSSP